MALLLYGFSCDMLGNVPLMFALDFPLGLLTRHFMSFRCGIGAQKWKSRKRGSRTSTRYLLSTPAGRGGARVRGAPYPLYARGSAGPSGPGGGWRTRGLL